MSQQDFLGTWSLHRTSGTPFGLGTEIAISDQGGLQVTFGGRPASIAYDGTSNLIQINGVQGMNELIFGVFADSGSGYRALYGGGRIVTAGVVGELVVCSAEAGTNAGTSQAATGAGAGADSTAQTAPAGTFRIVSTSGTQFGFGSTIELVEGSASTITNALGTTVARLDLEPVPGSEGSFGGSTENEDPALTLQCFVTTLFGESHSRIFGIDIVGDPENSGVWGGDEEVIPP